MKLSVIVPVYNEFLTIYQILKVVEAVPVDKEIIVVDDGSTDGTREVLSQNFEGRPGYRVVLHDKNYGKGRAIQTGIASARGEAVIIQDADMEYDPMDYPILLEAMKKNSVNIVYGSRFLNKKRVTSFWHRAVNFLLTVLSNSLFSAKLTDMETCYKLFRTDTLRSLKLSSDGFEIEVELTAKSLKKGERIIEVPISYKGRSFHEGKKIGWLDGLKAVKMIFFYRFSD